MLINVVFALLRVVVVAGTKIKILTDRFCLLKSCLCVNKQHRRQVGLYHNANITQVPTKQCPTTPIDMV